MGKSTKLWSPTALLAMPYMVWLFFFLIGPLLFILTISFQQKGLWGGIEFVWNIENYRRIFDPLYFKIFFGSVYLAASMAISCLLIGYPMAWGIARKREKIRKILLVLVMLPFMSNFVVRAYAVKFLIGVHGPYNQLLLFLNIIHSPLLMADPYPAIWFGMVTNYLPFMVLPLYVAFDRFDMSLLEASYDLGSSHWQTFRDVLWPLTKSAVLAGTTLVFVPALGEFVIPDLMGGGRTMFFGNLLADQFLKARDWPFGAAICVSFACTLAMAMYVWKLILWIFFLVKRGMQ